MTGCMKKCFIILGFVLFSALGFMLMQLPEKLIANRGPWESGALHMQNIDKSVMSVLDQCRLERVQGKLKGHAESAQCSTPTFRAAFEKEGFKEMGKVDEYLASRVEAARKLDNGEITDEEFRAHIGEGLEALLKFAPKN